ncbi:MAG TPA: CBS domain-containing protein [Acidimicrobiia bacterium]|nr:CBS domain-containing protein [Acidimicrobiia bacterium]
MTSPTWARVESLTRHEPAFVAPHVPLRMVSEQMWARSVGTMLVGSPDRLLGIVSERDIVAALARGADPDVATAAGVMTTDIVSVRIGDTLYDAAVDMLDVGIRHVPVVDDHGAVTGVVSVRDLLRPLLVEALGG